MKLREGIPKTDPDSIFDFSQYRGTTVTSIGMLVTPESEP